MSEWIPTYDTEGNLIELECPECGMTYYIDGTEPKKCKCGRALEYESNKETSGCKETKNVIVRYY